MPLSPNEIRDRAVRFGKEWSGASGERSEAQTFWNEFFSVFGVNRRRVATFEKRVQPVRAQIERATGEPHETRGGFIDLFWSGVLVAEHKSRGKDLDSAFVQALDYLDSLEDRELPRYVIVSDFARIRLHDLDLDTTHDVAVADLYQHVGLFGFIAGYSPLQIDDQDPVNIRAAEKMAQLYDRLHEAGYPDHDLKVLLVRLLFCLYAEDTTLFEPKGAFQDYLENNTREDGTDLGPTLNWLFDVLNVPPEKRQKSLDERIGSMPYVNGRLFEERLRTPAFDSAGRKVLLDCCGLDWGRISPAVFGALFQSVMDPEARRQIGAHYTDEANILKVIKPLFLDGLRAEFERKKHDSKALYSLHERIGQLKLFDPACGCGNFLVIAYRELRLLELDILRVLLKKSQEARKQHLNILELVQVNVDQFYGIEIEEFPAQIAQVALWLTDHQMNLLVSETFGDYYKRLPLKVSPTIVCGNALELDWNDVVPATEVDYVFGNPPFGGGKYQTDQQRGEMRQIFQGVKSAGLLDYVAAWYLKAVHYLAASSQDGAATATPAPADRVRVAFVSTNSIVQGEQVGVLWGELLERGVHIHFAHRTFQWQSEARGKAAVHCVIIGFALFDTADKRIYDYPDIKGAPVEAEADNINPYLVNAPDVTIGRRSQPLCDVPPLKIGNKPIDGGHYLFTEEEKEAFLEREPAAEPYFRPWIGAVEFLHGYHRWYLWLGECPPSKLKQMPLVMERVKAVQQYRFNSKSKPTRKLAETPTRFHVENIPTNPYMVIPEVTSENRPYIPFGYLEPEILASNKLRILRGATPYLFGVLSSSMHMSWTRYVSGRLKSDYQYSVSVTYNNFPWPRKPSRSAVQRVEKAAREVIKAREQFPESSLADLYDAVAMPPALRKAHNALDYAVDVAYGRRKFEAEPDRVAFLFEKYAELTSRQGQAAW